MAARKRDDRSRPGRRRGAGPAPKPRPRRRGAIEVTPAAEQPAADRKVRLNRFLAEAGVASRRGADGLIEQGRVAVNGERVRELGVRVDPVADRVELDGEPVQPERKTYVLFNKPKGVVCTNAPGEPRPRAIDFLTGVRGRLYTVGRLDADSEGLILITNDGDFAQRMAHPRYGVPKTYAVLVRGKVAPETAQKARGGVWLAEGRTGGAAIRIERSGRDRTYLKATIREGRNREIRRIFARLGHTVVSLKRVRIGDLTLHGLRPGGYRFLRADEVRSLRERAAEGSS